MAKERTFGMVYTEIKVKVLIDTKQLTEEQQGQARRADVDITQSHPLENGVDGLKDIIENISLSRFEYLGAGIKAVKIETE